MSNAVRGRGGRRGNRAVSNRMRNTLRHQSRADFSGFVPRGRTDPPRVLLTPWNTAVVSTLLIGQSTATNLCLSVSDIATQFRTQTGLTSGIPLSYRIINAQAWHIIPNGELNNSVRVRFFSLLQTVTSCNLTYVLAQVEDYGTPARNATAKYIWPKTHSSNVFSQDSTVVTMRFSLLAAQQILLHTTILWRFNGAATTVTDGETMSVSRCPISELFNSDFPDDDLSSLEQLHL